MNIVWVETVLDGIFWIAIMRVGIFWVGIFQVGVILGENFLWWGFSGWKLSGENHPGGNFPGGSFTSTVLIVCKVYPFSFLFFFSEIQHGK